MGAGTQYPENAVAVQHAHLVGKSDHGLYILHYTALAGFAYHIDISPDTGARRLLIGDCTRSGCRTCAFCAHQAVVALRYE
jgi:hypothetical protein